MEAFIYHEEKETFILFLGKHDVMCLVVNE